MNRKREHVSVTDAAVGPADESVRAARAYFLKTALVIQPRIGLTLLEYGDAGLDVWGNKWNLHDAWIIEGARFTLNVCEEDVRADGPFELERFFWPHETEEIDWGPTETIELHWNPDWQSERTFRRVVERQVIEHIERRRAMARDLGLVPVERPRKSANPFKWLVQHQCLGKGFREIARDQMVEDGQDVKNEDDVNSMANSKEEAIKTLAKYIGLTLRISPRGRASHTQRGARSRIPRHRT